MLDSQSLPYDTSADLEKEVIQRLRATMKFIPQECLIFREPWESTTIVCFDFQSCPNLLFMTQARANLILMACQDLSLAHSIIFRIGNKIVSWKNLKPAS